jgi:hypothetical protein
LCVFRFKIRFLMTTRHVLVATCCKPAKELKKFWKIKFAKMYSILHKKILGLLSNRSGKSVVLIICPNSVPSVSSHVGSISCYSCIIFYIKSDPDLNDHSGSGSSWGCS